MINRRSFAVTLAGAASTLMVAPESRAATLPRKVEGLAFLVNGRTMNLIQAIAGKPAVVEFILTTCGHCQAVAQALDRIYRDKTAQGLQVYALAINDNPNVPEFVRTLNLTFPVGTVNRELVYTFLQIPLMAQRMMMPQVVLIDRTGQVVAQHAGDDPLFNEPGLDSKLRAAVDKITAAKAPVRKKSATPAKGTSKK